jgi:molybdopterin converting factor small subunit
MVPGSTLRQVFDNLEAECPGIRARIIEEGRIRPEISVSVDNELVDTGLLYPVHETSEVYLLPAISGGADGAGPREIIERGARRANRRGEPRPGS